MLNGKEAFLKCMNKKPEYIDRVYFFRKACSGLRWSGHVFLMKVVTMWWTGRRLN